MPKNLLQLLPFSNAPKLPGWFVQARSLTLTVYFGAIVLCVSGIFIIGFVGMIGYRDWSNYTLAGNPWKPSHFPEYVIWPMRLMSVVGVMALVGIGFAVGDALILRMIRSSSASACLGRRLLAALITLLLELVLAAWLMRWI